MNGLSEHGQAIAMMKPPGLGGAVGALPDGGTLRDRFSSWFEVRQASTPALADEAFRLRYQVYCIENPFENAAEHVDGLERDEFDAHSEHTLLIHRLTGQTVGAVRLVLPRPGALDRSFPIQQVCSDPLLWDPEAFPLETMGELSRFALSKEVRRRSTDGFYGVSVRAAAPSEAGERRSAPPLRLGLMQGIVRMSAEVGLTHWCAVMEPSLLRILRSTAIHFEPIGPLVNFHGVRQPCYGDIRMILTRLRRAQPEVWDLLTEGGELWERLTASRRPARVPLLPAE